MKRLTKWLICVGLFMTLAGGIMSLASWMMGAQTHALDDKISNRLEDIGQVGVLGRLSRWGYGFAPHVFGDSGEQGDITSASSTNIEAFENLDIDLDIGDVNLMYGDAYSVSIVNWGQGYEVYKENKNGTLRIWNEKKWGNQNDGGATVNIYLPQGAVLDQVDLELAMGDLTWEEVILDGDLQCDLAMGSGVVEAPLTGQVQMSSGMGDITIIGKVEGQLDASVGMGDVSLTVIAPERDYEYDLSTGLGEIYLNGEEQSGTSLDQGKGKYDISIDTGMGDVWLSFEE